MQRAVTVGLTRSEGKPIGAMVDAVMDAIEMALALEAEERASKPLDLQEIRNIEPVVPVAPVSAPPPPSSASVVEDRVPARSPEESSDIGAQAGVQRVTSLRGIDSERPKLTLQKLVEVLHSHTPEEIEIERELPDGGKRKVTLVRNVIADVMTDTARLVYKHPMAGDDMAVVSVINVSDGIPDLRAVIDDSRSRAKRLYALRPAHIEPAAPPPTAGFGLSIPKLDLAEAMAEEKAAPNIGEVAGRRIENFRFGK